MEIKLLQKERNSSFELLRIISMFLIVMHHYSVHGGFDFMIPFSMKLYFVQCLDMGGKLGVNLFVLISGYFLCKSDFKWKRIIKLEVEVIFYSILIGVIFHFLMPERESIKDLIKELTPLRTGSYCFYNTYFVMVLFAPFINKFLVSLEKTDLKKLLFLMSVLWVLIPVLPKVGALQMSNLGWFIFLYLCSAYIRFYPEDFSFKNKTFLLFGIGIYILVLLSVLSFDLLGFIDKRFQGKFDYFLPMNSILIFLSSIMLFIGFSKISLGSKKIINILSSATFGIYLIHDNHLARPFLWKDLFRNAVFINSNQIFLHAIIVICTVYIVCTTFDLLRQYLLEKPLFHIIEKIQTKCDNKIENT